MFPQLRPGARIRGVSTNATRGRSDGEPEPEPDTANRGISVTEIPPFGWVGAIR
jgi:hypothetical protein